MANKVFLGGTCTGRDWRSELIPNVKYPCFNPIVDNWNEEAQKQEELEKKTSLFTVYVITSDMEGVFSCCEAVEDSCTKPATTIVCVLFDNKFSTNQIKSLMAMLRMCKKHGAIICNSIEQIATYLNTSYNKVYGL